ncbi:ATP-binding cassette domain-containing protein [Lacisediminihabitans sp. H27-G8]|uniref:ABC transporter ATP-binding protein n=1 Tax=Lacisediminihabitans sp. H27-G8 TaxID=3111909 RepID=UPI0038FC890E
MPSIIEAASLSKNFGRVRALDGLELDVTEGEVHGFLGPNGAGKSTTLRVLLGLIRASGGATSVFGLDPWRDSVAVHRRLAYVPGDVDLWPGLTGGEAIDLLTSLRGGADEALRAELVDEFEFDPRITARNYSKGNRQKVALIAAFARPAELYLFDEPTSGLDPVMEAVFRRRVERVVAGGATVLLSSHILSEVEQLCDRVTIIRAGRTVETGSLSDLRHLTRTTFSAVTAADVAAVAALSGVHDARREGEKLVFEVDTDALPPVLAALAGSGVSGLTVAPPSLEDLFLRHYGDDLARGSGRSA